MMVYFIYYRVALLYGVWLPYIVEQGFQVIAFLMKTLWVEKCERSQKGLKGAIDFVVQMSMNFVASLVCAAFMNALFWLFCQLFFGADLEFAVQEYFWGFVRDLFGSCAASGYQEAFGFDCLD